MSSLNRWTRFEPLFPLIYLLLAGVLWSSLWGTNQVDLNFITYRFANNLHTGNALVYGTSAPAISTFPLVPALLAVAAISGLPLPILGSFLSIILTVVGAFFLARLVEDQRRVGIAYVIAAVALPSPVVLTMLALALAGLEFAKRQRWAMAGILIGLAILAEPSAIGLAVLTWVVVLRTSGAVWRYIVPAVLIPAVGLLLVWFALDRQGIILSPFVPNILPILLSVAALVALVRHYRRLNELPSIAILAAWSAIILLFSLLSSTFPTAAILPGLIALVSLLKPRWLLVLAVCLDLFGTVFVLNSSIAAPTSIATGTWLAANTGLDALIASPDVGAVAFYAGRTWLDVSDRLQPIKYDRDFFLHYAPDVVVLRSNAAYAKPAWEPFATTYANVHQEEIRPGQMQTVYQRVINYSSLDDHGVDVNYSALASRNDLRLVSVAIGNTLHPGDFVRIRLDWQVAYPPQRDIQVKLTLLNAKGLPIVGIRDNLQTEKPGSIEPWSAGKVSTYHLLVLPNDAPVGQTALYLGMSIQGAESADLSVATINVVK